jgi:hypothetical protein
MDTLEVIDLFLCAPVLYSKAKQFLNSDFSDDPKLLREQAG